jgi:hypothetical protein
MHDFVMFPLITHISEDFAAEEALGEGLAGDEKDLTVTEFMSFVRDQHFLVLGVLGIVDFYYIYVCRC